MRGDRPSSLLPCVVGRGATPHARGSTAAARLCLQLGPGYPACAGIDPAAARHGTPAPRLPRMRGDRPHSWCSRRRTSRATPHARGSTLPEHVDVGVRSGYPACAGIDPTVIGRSCRDMRLPRMRGDRPFHPNCRHVVAAATPHARGSTRPSAPSALPMRGYPACAGIDPIPVGYRLLPSRLPRMRGDRPRVSTRCWSSRRATPHARGSTIKAPLQALSSSGYPACAGIDPDHP